MAHPLRLFLIGPRGCGKSTVARYLAKRLGYDWVDSDVEVERRTGKSIAAIFAEEGEHAFRLCEAQVIAELVHCERTVVSLGGGSLVRRENRDRIAGAGPVVLLTASVDTLVDRLRRDVSTKQRRPRLTELDERAEMESILVARLPIYLQCASIEIDTEDKRPAEIAEEIVALLQLG